MVYCGGGIQVPNEVKDEEKKPDCYSESTYANVPFNIYNCKFVGVLAK